MSNALSLVWKNIPLILLVNHLVVYTEKVNNQLIKKIYLLKIYLKILTIGIDCFKSLFDLIK